MYITLSINNYTTLLASFITYRIQAQIPSVYYESIKPSAMKPTPSYIGSKPLSIARKRFRTTPEKKHNKGWKRYMAELIYLMSNTVYVSLYFYFCRSWLLFIQYTFMAL
jgi:hypothetical protein